MSVFPEVTHISPEAMSFGAELYGDFQGRYTHLGDHVPEIQHAVSSDLTKSIARLLPLIQDECRYAFGTSR